jgi:hypothetical protein
MARDYPTIDEVRAQVAVERPDWDVRVAEDVIHVGPRRLLLAP